MHAASKNSLFPLLLGRCYELIEEQKPEDERDYTIARDVYIHGVQQDFHDENTAKMLYNLGRIYHKNKEYLQSCSAFIQAIKSNPMMFKAYLSLIVSYIQSAPWKRMLDSILWISIVIVFGSIYIRHRIQLRKKMVSQTIKRGEQS